MVAEVVEAPLLPPLFPMEDNPILVAFPTALRNKIQFLEELVNEHSKLS